MRTQQAWSVTPSAAGDVDAQYRVAHGQGYSVISHHHGALEVNATWCVDDESAVKQVRIRLVNRGHRTMQLRLIGIAEWILGAQRSDRASTFTSMAGVDAAPGSDTVATGAQSADEGGRATVLFCTQRDRSAGFGGGTAFFALAGDREDLTDWTCDRREMFDARGRAIVPDHFGKRQRLRRSIRARRSRRASCCAPARRSTAPSCSATRPRPTPRVPLP